MYVAPFDCATATAENKTAAMHPFSICFFMVRSSYYFLAELRQYLTFATFLVHEGQPEPSSDFAAQMRNRAGSREHAGTPRPLHQACPAILARCRDCCARRPWWGLCAASREIR